MAKLLSVNVGLPREIEWQGKLVRTGIWKLPVSGRVFARRLNLNGDGQGDLAGHGGEHRAVMVYQIDAYRYWEKVLNRNDFEHGQFGENFTVEGLADDEVCIGDRYSIGNAVFEVTQPRVTCYRLGIRMNNPQMAALLVSHRRPGFYFRVITEGEVGAGDEIQKIADGPGRITVAEVDGLLYLPNHDAKRIAIAVDIPALSGGWKGSLEELLKADEQGVHSGNAGLTSSIASPPLWNGFRTLRVGAVHQETNEVKSIVLESADGVSLPAALPGQYLVLRLYPDKGSRPVVRSYSISGACDAGTYRISVKRDTGPGSQYIADVTQAGDMLEVSAPRGEFVLRSGIRPVVLLSAGIGATPVLSMLHALASNSAASHREVWWIHGTRSGGTHGFVEETRGLLKAAPGSHSVIVYSKAEPTDRLGKDFDLAGRLDLDGLRKLGMPLDADFYLCGPAGFQNDITRALASLSVPANTIHQEIFGSVGSITPGVVKAEVKLPHPPTASTGNGPLVSFTRSNLTVPWDNRFRSLLEFAEACGVPVRWSCRTGVCHMCECGLLSGNVHYSPDPLDQPAGGNALICCSTPESQVDLDL
ncbi:MOSC domain-containing protein [Terriglobus albidus]|uniref:MOSC domain-containing protein n=1 Tax=Terriglobus albidus TaxID=1592106 RepID=A0A5B9EK81_9BACT|nr:MOSC and FAD-binding oxidoreductase domain-containing protein [Terriglobus albidus]QEE30486.1 MOSC domain-containing protein [Terriglobus albidus]